MSRSMQRSMRLARPIVLAIALIAAVLVVPPQQHAAAAACDPPVQNPIVCENSKPGSPASEWEVDGAGSSAIQGFATDISVNHGGTIGFKVDTTASSFRLDIYRMGYYGGDGARKITTINPTSVTDQPQCLTDPTTGLVDCGNWSLSASWSVPDDAVSGIYFARLVRTDGTSGASMVPFVVRNDGSHSDMLFQTSDTTWQAYNRYGGNSLYTGQPANRAYKVSYNRPFTTREYAPEDFVFNAEYPMVRFLEANGYDVSYASGLDTARRGAELLQHKVFLSVGHDEYWSGEQRANVEAARDAGVNLAFLSGNEMFWKTRWEPSIDSSHTANRTLVSYKETHADAVIDPQDPPTWTGTWRDPRFSPPADGGRPENGLTGQIFMVNCCDTDMVVAAPEGKMRFWRNTRVASLTGDQTTTVGSDIVGYEWDEDLDNGARPAGLFRVSEMASSGEILQDYGTNYGPGAATHSMTEYRAPSGALVFGAGTVQWSWGLDSNHDRGPSDTADDAARQATVNLFADMGVQPATLQSGLTPATASTDTTPPTSSITSPTAGTTIPVNEPAVVAGTAIDSGGGRVGGVEVSVDNGQTWHRATGRESWTYTFTPQASGSITIRSRATDDSGRIETPSTGVTVTVDQVQANCPCTIWPSTAIPNGFDSETSSVELGVKFRAVEDGYITGIRFYKGAQNTGTHVGSLWTGNGTRLGQVTFTGETASGWQQADFANPIQVSAGNTYVASYFAPNGSYGIDSDYFSSAFSRGPLTALQSGTDGGNGVYRYGSTPSNFPSGSFLSSNYWVDVVFDTTAEDTTKPTVTERSPAPNATDVPLGKAVSATFSENVDAGTVTMALSGPGGSTVAGSTTYDAGTRTATFTPAADLSPTTEYTVTVQGAKDSAGNQMDSVSWSFTTRATAGACPCTIWPSSATPQTPSENDTNGTEVGVKFRADEDGYITGLRFYKSAQNTGTHVGSLWTSTGSRLGQVTFTGETASGWQQADFANPIQVSAGTTYVASYYAPNGHYAGDDNFFTGTAVTRGPLTALQSGTDGGNGVYRYAATPGNFPSGTYNGENYWVDVVFDTTAEDTTKPAVTGRSPAADATDVALGKAVSATFSENVDGGTVTMALSGPGGSAVAGSTTYDAGTRTATFTPDDDLTANTEYTVTVQGAKDSADNQMDSVSWSFTTAAPATCPCTIWPASATPQTPSENDTNGTEVGVKFRATEDGYITGLRFYKSAQNTGTHVGSLWTSTGSRLGQVTFTGETASGWQQADFANPIQVSAGTTYVASYYAPNGHYAGDDNFFTGTAVTRGPLTALQSGTDGGNGVYRYGSTPSNFPTGTYNGENYWVDVVFDTTAEDTSKPRVVDQHPAVDEAGILTTDNITATFNEPVTAGSISMSLEDAAQNTVDGAVTYDAGARRATFNPNADLAADTTYTVRVSGATDESGNVMDPTSWSFTTVAPVSCPCSIWTPTTVPTTAAASDDGAVEVGVRFRAAQDGYITGIRFYKGAGNTGTHIGSLWSGDGTNLGQVTFTGETATGWQQANFANPIQISAGTTYVASYHAPNGRYSLDGGYFTDGGATRGPLTALQSGVDGGNGVYQYGGSAFPTETYDDANYWVDVVFDTSAVDHTPPAAQQLIPADGSTGAPIGSPVSITFTEPVNPGPLTAAVTDPGGSAIAVSQAYDAPSRTLTLTPTTALDYSTEYSVNVDGISDAAGNTAAPISWTFTTGAEPPPPPDQGPGGPIAVVVGPGSSSYLAEILRAEGMDQFSTIGTASLTPATLADYDVVVLGAITLTTGEVNALTDWVNGGGNLIAMRPTAQLASLMGITVQSGTVDNGYLAVNTGTEAGAGITGATMQYHGPASRYALAGASQVARLYSDATTATTASAVTLRDVGSNGGQAAAFAYDLATSVVQTHQGNPAWAGQERDANPPIRSDDMFFGGSSPDWVNLDKVRIPQADEQQRLLANLITVMSRDQLPMPRFWYFPRMAKAVVVATGDDHGGGDPQTRYQAYRAASPAGCSVVEWECKRFTSYLYSNFPMTESAAASLSNEGFEIALHPQNNCNNFSSTADLRDTYADEVATWLSRFPSIGVPKTNRFHCMVWSDWASQATVEGENGMRLDVNYYYWPGSWLADRPGFMTGSGIPMRFADTDGSLIDVYQSPTVMTDESGQSYPYTPDTLLDGALGPDGYYGAFTANLHTDDPAATYENDSLLASAASRGVPVVTARQLLTWLDGRNASSFDDLSYSGGVLSFGITAGTGANGLTAMLPTAGPGGRTLASISRGGSAVSYTTQTIKGISYAVFTAQPGDYSASYTTSAAAQTEQPTAQAQQTFDALLPQGARVPPTADGTAPTISDVSVLAMPDGTARVSWTTDEPADSTIRFGTSGLGKTTYSGDLVRSHQLVVSDLRPDRAYRLRVGSTDAAGNVAEQARSTRFTTPASGLAQQTWVSFAAGRTSGHATLVRDGNGWLTLRGSGRGVYVSTPQDSAQMVTWLRAIWQAEVPAGATMRISVRTGDTSRPGAGWTDWQRVTAKHPEIGTPGRYVQYRVVMSAKQRPPRLLAIGFSNDAKPVVTHGEDH